MAHHLSRRMVRVAIAAGVLGCGFPFGAGSVTASSVPHPHAAAHTLFSFGREGGNIRPLTVTIDDIDAVTITPSDTNTTRPHLSADALAGLLALARAEGFFKLPPQIVGHGLPDAGGRFITVHTPATMKTVHVRFVRDAAFDQLYAVLTAVAGVAS